MTTYTVKPNAYGYFTLCRRDWGSFPYVSTYVDSWTVAPTDEEVKAAIREDMEERYKLVAVAQAKSRKFRAEWHLKNYGTPLELRITEDKGSTKL